MVEFSLILCPLCGVRVLPYYDVPVRYSGEPILTTTIIKPFCEECAEKLSKLIKDVR